MTFKKKLNLPSNDKGRDFIIGDLHGMYELLLEEMASVNFDIAVDRLFCVGDLTDRGPNSAECLALLKEPWFFATLGNHDYMLCTYAVGTPSSYHRGRDFIANGGGWIHEFDEESQKEMANLVIERMPVMIETPDFFVTHAKMWNEARDYYDVSSIVWDRSIFDTLQGDLTDVMERYKVNTDPIFRMDNSCTDKPVYVGHTTIRYSAVYIDGHINLDTGAYRHPKGKLTMVNHADVVEWLK